MNNKKIINILVIICILITNINITSNATIYYKNDKYKYEGISGDILFDTLILPAEYENKPTIQVPIRGKMVTLRFNTELWVDYNIGVYGDYRYVPSNDFKNYTENPDPAITTPYYTKNGVKGEYRYHGYSIDGIKYTNDCFPVDQAYTRKPETKTWQYHYWENPIMSKRDDDKISDFNDQALFGDADTQQWINGTFPFKILNGNKKEISMQPYDYANVLTPSSLVSHGECRMWHKNNSGYWYQTFSLKKREGKKQTPIELDVNILNKGHYNIYPSQEYITVAVDITITLNDEFCFDDSKTHDGNDIIQQQIFYNRKDINQYYLKINDEEFRWKGDKETNTCHQKIMLKIPRNKISKSGDFEVKGIAHIEYGELSTIRSDNAEDNDNDTVNKTVVGGAVHKYVPTFSSSNLKSVFSVTNAIDQKITPLTPSLFDYQDLSVGDRDKYTFEITGTDLLDDNVTITKIYNTSSIDSDTINQILYNMSKGKTFYKIIIKQTISKTIASEKDSSSDDKENDEEKEPATTEITDTFQQMILIWRTKEVIKIDVELPDKVFDIHTYNATINGMKQKDIDRLHVTIDGIPIHVSVDDFFNNRFSFGAIENLNNSELHLVEISATSEDDLRSSVQRWVTVYNTKPKAQLELTGTLKENRKFETTNTSDNINDPYLINHYPTSYSYEITALNNSDITKLNYENHGENYIFQSSKKGTYQIKCTATNDTGRSSTYTLPLVVSEDYKPAMNFNIWNNYLARNEKLLMEYGVESIDEDTITNKTITIYKDKDKNGTYETKILTKQLTDDFTYTPKQLGFYRAIISADESYGQQTVTKWLHNTRHRSNTITRDFFVENLRPLAEVHLDIPYNFPKVDVILALDKNLSNDKKTKIKSKKVQYDNYLRSFGINPVISMWDMKVYEHTTPASTSRNTGSSYPSNSIPYTSGKYFGTLTLNNAVNNYYYQDFGGYVSRRECHTEEQCCHPKYGCHSGGCDCGVSGHAQGGDCGDSVYTTNEVCEIVQVYESNVQLVDDYTGYYSGTLYKYIRQKPPINIFRPDSQKYIIYISEDGINTTSSSEHKGRLVTKEFNDIIKAHDLTIGLIGNDIIKTQSHHYDNYYPNNDILGNIDKFLKNIADVNPFSSDYLVQLGDKINIESIELESEGDELKENGFKYVHNPNIYDNPIGTFSFAQSDFIDDKNWTSHKPTILNKTGKLEIYHKVKDSIKDYEDEELYSNIYITSINIHRRPICDFDLDWTYDQNNKVYKTTWIDKSYDLDHEFNHKDKGIIDRKIIYWDNAYPSEKYYKIPDNLQPGATYTVSYSVKDLEKTWSDQCIKQYTLPTIPPPQILQTKLKAELSKFSLNSIPASEKLISYDTITRFPYNHYLEMALYKQGTKVSNNLEVHNTGSQATIKGQDYTWIDSTYNIPSTLKSGNYRFRLYAVSEGNRSNKAYKAFDVTIDTPINLKSTIPKNKITYDRETTLSVTTSKYANSVSVTLYKGTSYERTRNLTLLKQENELKYWALNYKEERISIPDGNYNAQFKATLPSEEFEIENNVYEFTHNTPPTVSIKATDPIYVYEGDNVFADIQVHDIDLDTLTIVVELLKDGTIINTKNIVSNPNGSMYDLVKAHLKDDISPGNYEIKVTVDDGNGGIAKDNKIIMVYELSITGYVDHTPKWNENRKKYNNSKTNTDNSPRDYTTYWAGERFIVSADTTIINPQSTVEAKEVEVKILQEPYRINLITKNKTNWNGELWENSMIHRWGRKKPENLSLQFTVVYNNGTVKKDTVVITIDDMENYWRYHRKF
jgi:hypothetical protein